MHGPAGVSFSSVVAWWSHLYLHLWEFQDQRQTGHGRTNDDRCLSSLDTVGTSRFLNKEEAVSAPTSRQEEGVHAGRELLEVKEGHGSYSHPEAFVFYRQDTFEYQRAVPNVHHSTVSNSQDMEAT